jgi:hypothetical protein
MLSPLEADIIPLPHQLYALNRSLQGDYVRFLLADEVGLGKTIEAGLIMRELKLRGEVERVLVLAPKSLLVQWVQEMGTRFGESFELVQPSANGDEVWKIHPQVVVSMDSVKPMEKRRGWTDAQIDTYNRKRFGALIDAGWDLVIIDEAHKVAGASENVARHQLARGLADTVPHLLLLSATPHSGKTEAFHRLMSLLDTEAFPSVDSVSRVGIDPLVRKDSPALTRGRLTMLRVAGSLKMGTIKASELMRSLLRSQKPSTLAKAIAALGRIPKTLYLLSYIDDENYRRHILTQINRGEKRHHLSKATFHGQRGELRKRYREGQEDQLSALGLVVNVIVLWNTLYMEEALTKLRTEGFEVKNEEVQRLWPLGFKHINFLGRYSFAIPESVANGQLRPLNTPDDLEI